MGKRSLIEGEKTALVIITIFCIAALEESIRVLYRDPGITTAGFVPVLVTSIMLIMVFFTWRETNCFSPIYSEKDDIKKRISLTMKKILPRQIIISIIFLIIYAFALPILHFNITTFLFLAASMIAFRAGNWKKALVLSFGSVATILIIFNLIFKVILP